MPYKKIKTAFWDAFHESGEQFFNYLGTSEENTDATEALWQDLLRELQEQEGD